MNEILEGENEYGFEVSDGEEAVEAVDKQVLSCE